MVLIICAALSLGQRTIMHVINPGSMALEGGRFGEGAGPIWLTNVNCSGDEERLFNCIASSNGMNSCTHAQDAGVRCQQGKCVMIECHLIHKFTQKFQASIMSQ